MTTAIGKCMICGDSCPNPMWICHRCREKFPELKRSYTRWPKWARALRNIHEVEREHEQDILDFEIELDPDSFEALLEAVPAYDS